MNIKAEEHLLPRIFSPSVYIELKSLWNWEFQGQ